MHTKKEIQVEKVSIWLEHAADKYGLKRDKENSCLVIFKDVFVQFNHRFICIDYLTFIPMREVMSFSFTPGKQKTIGNKF